MSAPDATPSQMVWLGRHDTPAEDGWLRVRSDVRDAQLATFQQRTTIGDATKDSEDFISSLIVSDLTGGGQVEEMNEGSDANRYFDGVMDTRSTGGITLPPLVREYRPSGVTGAVSVYPLGDTCDTAQATAQFAVAFGTAVHLWSEAAGAFGAAASTALGGVPRERGTLFYSSAGSQTYLYVPLGSAGYAIVYDNGSTAAVANNAASGSIPAAASFAVWNNNLYCIDTAGYLWFSVDGGTWAKKEDGTGADMPRLNPSRTPKKLLVYYDQSGDTQLYVVTNRDVWTVDLDQARWTLTTLQPAPHPDFGLDACIWRPGEDLWVAAGADAIKYTAAGVIVPLAGLARDEGVPVYKAGRIKSFQPEPSSLYALVEATGAGQFHQLHAWTGVGWHKVWEQGAAVAGSPSWLCIQAGDNAYRLWWGLGKGYAATMTLPREQYNARQGMAAGQEFAEEGTIVTGWFDAAMSGFDKLASHVTIDMASASDTETFAVGYLVDSDDPVVPYAAFGETGTGDGEFADPRAVAVAADGTVWVADTGNDRVQQFAADGTYLAQFGSAGTGNGEFDGPAGIAIDGDGNLWVVDAGNNRVQKFDADGTYLAKFGSAGTGNGQLDGPAAVAIDAGGNLWVADAGNNRVQRFDSSGAYVSKFGAAGSGFGQFADPRGVAIDGDGNLVVSQHGGDRVQVFDPSGTCLLEFGSHGPGNGQFDGPAGVAVDAGGDIWVVDEGNHRVQRFDGGGVWVATVPFGAVTSAETVPLAASWTLGSASDVQRIVSGATIANQPNLVGATHVRFAASVATPGSANATITFSGLNKAGTFYVPVGSPGQEPSIPIGSVGHKVSPWVAISDDVDLTAPFYVRSLVGTTAGAVLTDPQLIVYRPGDGGSAIGAFNAPWGVAVTADDEVFVTDAGNDRVQSFDPSVVAQPGGADAYPTAYTPLGSADATGKTVVAFDPDADGFAEGVTFNRIRFALSLARDPLRTRVTPVLRAFTFHYTKIPQNTASYAIDVLLPPDGDFGRSAQQVRAYLADLLTADTFLKFVVNGEEERVRLAGMSSTRATGDDYSGVVQLSLIAVRA